MDVATMKTKVITSEDELFAFIDDYQMQTKYLYSIKNSKTLNDAIIQKIPCNASLGYDEAKFSCIRVDDFKSKGSGLRKSSTQKTNCQSFIQFRTSLDGKKTLRVTGQELQHNHEPEEADVLTNHFKKQEKRRKISRNKRKQMLEAKLAAIADGKQLICNETGINDDVSANTEAAGVAGKPLLLGQNEKLDDSTEAVGEREKSELELVAEFDFNAEGQEISVSQNTTLIREELFANDTIIQMTKFDNQSVLPPMVTRQTGSHCDVVMSKNIMTKFIDSHEDLKNGREEESAASPKTTPQLLISEKFSLVVPHDAAEEQLTSDDCDHVVVNGRTSFKSKLESSSSVAAESEYKSAEIDLESQRSQLLTPPPSPGNLTKDHGETGQNPGKTNEEEEKMSPAAIFMQIPESKSPRLLLDGSDLEIFLARSINNSKCDLPRISLAKVISPGNSTTQGTLIDVEEFLSKEEIIDIFNALEFENQLPSPSTSLTNCTAEKSEIMNQPGTHFPTSIASVQKHEDSTSLLYLPSLVSNFQTFGMTTPPMSPASFPDSDDGTLDQEIERAEQVLFDEHETSDVPVLQKLPLLSRKQILEIIGATDIGDSLFTSCLSQLSPKTQSLSGSSDLAEANKDGHAIELAEAVGSYPPAKENILTSAQSSVPSLRNPTDEHKLPSNSRQDGLQEVKFIQTRSRGRPKLGPTNARGQPKRDPAPMKFQDKNLFMQLTIILRGIIPINVVPSILNRELKISRKHVDYLLPSLLNDSIASCNVNLNVYNKFFEPEAFKILKTIIKTKKKQGPWTCERCQCEAGDDTLECKSCLRWYHVECESISESVKGTWFCSNCKKL